MKKQYMTILLRLALSVILLGLLFVLIDRDALLKAFSSVEPVYYILGLVAYGGAVLFWALRWHLFIRAAGEPVSFLRALATLLTGYFYAMFLPTIVGTDVGRMYELGRDSNKKTHVVSTVLLDRLMGLISLAVIALVALLIGYQFASGDGIALTVVVVVVALVVGWILFFHRRLMEWVFGIVFRLPVLGRVETSVRDMYEMLFYLHNQPRLLLSSGLVSLLNNIAETLAVFLVARALGVDINPVYFFIFMPLVWLIIIIPISIGGLGLREGAFAFFFSQVGISAADAVAISLLYYSFTMIVGVVGGLVLLRFSIAEYRQKLLNKRAVA